MKSLKNNYSITELLQTSALFVFFFSIFYYITLFLSNSDMPEHIYFAEAMSKGAMNYAGNFILYGLMNILSFCLSSIFFLVKVDYRAVGLCLLLATAVTYKFRWTYKHLPEYTTPWNKFLLALSLIFVVAIPIPSFFITNYWYIGNFTPNVWHNSTIIFLFPFAIILFLTSIKQIEEFSNRRNLWLILLVFLNVFIKPSYFFVWVIIYPFFLLIEYRLTSRFFKGLIPVAAGIVFLAIAYIWIYYFNNDVGEASSVIINPFKGYLIYSPLSLLPCALIFSLLFPVSYFAFNLKRLYQNKVFLFAYTALFIAIVIFLLFLEDGRRMWHLNFYWQIIICTWLCFYITLNDWLENKKQLMQSKNNRKKIVTLYVPMAIYAVHVIIGIAYLGRYLYTNCYF